tara:strand:- start:829 stop:1215 length:387 start_codon:yes stop_codon:yes gene_type:complete
VNIKSSKTLIEEALSQINTIEPSEAKKLIDNDKCNLIDIRETTELENLGRVDKACHIPRGMLEFWIDPNSQFFANGQLDANKEMVLFCAGGIRSALAAKTLLDMGYENVSHINGGFSLMEQEGFEIIK